MRSQTPAAAAWAAMRYNTRTQAAGAIVPRRLMLEGGGYVSSSQPGRRPPGRR